MSFMKGKIGVWVNDTKNVVDHLHRIKNVIGDGIGFDYVILRAFHRGGSGFFTDELLERLSADAKSIDLPVVLWGYMYPIPSDLQVSAIELAFRKSPNACGLILDCEREWENVRLSSTANDIAHDIAAKTNHALPLHLSSFGAPSLHPSFPFKEFCSHCSSWQPQAYIHGDGQGNSAARVLARTLSESVHTLTLEKELIVTIDDPSQVSQFVNKCDGMNVWLAFGDGSDPGVFDNVKNIQDWHSSILQFKNAYIKAN